MKLDSLLYEQESSTLDFKRDCYKFSGATDEEKSEILKDILAFSNAWRRSEAVILLGVEEIKGGKHKVIGITEDLDDASLQQFVQSKTQKPVIFEYRAETLEGCKVGMLRIPVQKRPLYLTRDYGKLKKHTVYIRRGTSTGEASPDEVSEMAISENLPEARAPHLVISFADIKNRLSLGPELVFSGIALDIPKSKDIPDYSERSSNFLPSFALTNEDYYRELVNWFYIRNIGKQFGFVIDNSSASLAQDVRVEISTDRIGDDLSFLPLAKLPEYPARHHDMVSTKTLAEQMKEVQALEDITITKTQSKWLINVAWDKVRPKQTVFTTSGIFVIVKTSKEIVCRTHMYADNLPAPIEQDLIVKPDIKSQPGDLETIRKMGRKLEQEIQKRRTTKSGD